MKLCVYVDRRSRGISKYKQLRQPREKKENYGQPSSEEKILAVLHLYVLLYIVAVLPKMIMRGVTHDQPKIKD